MSLTLAAIAAALPAQTVDITWSVSNPVVSPDNPTTTVRMSADWGNDAWFFGSTIFDALATNGAGADIGQRQMNGVESFFNSTGEVMRDNSILGIEPFCLPPFLNGDCPIPVEVWFDYTATDFTERTVEYTSEHEVFIVYIDDFGTSFELDAIVEGTTFRVVPTPATATVLVLTLAARRRR